MDIGSILLGAWLLILTCLNVFLVASVEDDEGKFVNALTIALTILTVWAMTHNYYK